MNSYTQDTSTDIAAIFLKKVIASVDILATNTFMFIFRNP